MVEGTNLSFFSGTLLIRAMKETSQGKNDKYGNCLVSLGSKLRHLFICFIFSKETLVSLEEALERAGIELKKEKKYHATEVEDMNNS